MLSNCRDCQFYHPELCAVNPLYRERADRWKDKLSQQDLADLSFLGAELQPCADWRYSVELEPVTVELTLSRRQWLQLAQALAKADLFAAIAPQLQAVLPDSQEIQMEAVDSSNVEAIGYDSLNQVLQVDFLSGSRYRYLQVPPGVFHNFLVAPSKGSFLNYRIKGTYGYERVS